jgi:hypothetical protein
MEVSITYEYNDEIVGVMAEKNGVFCHGYVTASKERER